MTWVGRHDGGAAGKPSTDKAGKRPWSSWPWRSGEKRQGENEWRLSQTSASTECVYSANCGSWSDHRLGQLRRLNPRASKKVLVQRTAQIGKGGASSCAPTCAEKSSASDTQYPRRSARPVINLLGLLSDWGVRHAPRQRRRHISQRAALIQILAQ